MGTTTGSPRPHTTEVEVHAELRAWLTDNSAATRRFG
jgi:hypothetical protein